MRFENVRYIAGINARANNTLRSHNPYNMCPEKNMYKISEINNWSEWDRGWVAADSIFAKRK